jgi:hypothetical protein
VEAGQAAFDRHGVDSERKSCNLAMMAERMHIDLNRLRQIGWDLWNPIGLDDAWRAAAPDEYDRYLLHIADMASTGRPADDAATYLIDIASRHMGLPCVNRQAAFATASAIVAYVEGGA